MKLLKRFKQDFSIPLPQYRNPYLHYFTDIVQSLEVRSMFFISFSSNQNPFFSPKFYCNLIFKCDTDIKILDLTLTLIRLM